MSNNLLVPETDTVCLEAEEHIEKKKSATPDLCMVQYISVFYLQCAYNLNIFFRVELEHI